MAASYVRRLLRRLIGAPWLLVSDPNDATLKLLVENSRDVLCRLGPDFHIRYCSPSARAVLGRSPDEMIGRLPSSFVLEEDRPIIAAAAQRVMGGGEAEPTIVRVPRPDGGMVWVETTTRTLRDPETGQPAEIILCMRDVSERQALQRRLEHQATTDSLTGLANRRAFDEALAREWARAVRENGELSLILLDVDHFKLFNDHYGHQVGDDCLRDVAAAIRDVVRRPGDIAARYGGEEMAVILPDTPPAGAATVAEALREAVRRLGVQHAGSPCGVLTASVGAATAKADVGRTISMPDGLLIGADGALYRAKHNGRDRVETSVLLPPRDSVRAA